MQRHITRSGAAQLFVALLACATLAGTGQSRPAHEITLDFNTAEVGQIPADFSTALTGGGGPGSWVILEDPTAPSGGRVLAQASTDKTSSRFPLCLYDKLTATDVTFSVRFKAVSGTVDQAAGLVVRFQDKDNYYIVRANALEDNVRLYKVERGQRAQLAGVNVKIPASQWHRLSLAVKGTHFRVSYNEKLLFEAEDATFKNAGKIGLWTKADSVTYFDDLVVIPSGLWKG
jgi:hypothetical protein